MTPALGRAIGVLPLALYAGAIPVVANLQIDRNVRLLLYQSRSYVILGAVVVSLVGLVAFSPHRVVRAFRTPWHRQLITASLLFPVVFAASALIKGRLDVPVLGLYFVWAAAVFFVAPLLLDTRARLGAAVIALLVANALAWVLGYYLFQTAPRVTTFEERESFGYSNPNTYGQILQVIGCCAAYLALTARGRLLRGRRARLALAVVGGLCAVLVIAAASRNVVAFGLAAVVCYLFLRGRRWRQLLAPLLIAGTAVVIISTLAYVDLTEVDRFSSGRLSRWQTIIEVVFVRDDNAGALLFGRDREVSERLTHKRYSDIHESAAFEKFHADNFYLELIVEAGLIGTLLFLWPYILLAAMFWRLRRKPGERTRANLGLALLGGLAVQGVFTPTIPSFNNPIGFMFAIVAVSMVAVSANRREGSDGG